MPDLFNARWIGRLIGELRRDVAQCRRFVSLVTAAFYKVAFILALALVGSDYTCESEANPESAKEVLECLTSSWARLPRAEVHAQATGGAPVAAMLPSHRSVLGRRFNLPFSFDSSTVNGLRAPPVA